MSIGVRRALLKDDNGARTVNGRDTKGWSALMLASRTYLGDEMVRTERTPPAHDLSHTSNMS